jgi:hypothetical protein
VATTLLLGLIGGDDVGICTGVIRTDALTAAGLIFAAVACGSALKWKT